MDDYADAERDYIRHQQQVRLKLLPGGKSGPPYSDWLSELSINSVFLVDYQETCGSRTMFLPRWQIISKSTLAVELWDVEQDKRVWVIPFNFCQDYKLYELLHNAASGSKGQEEREVDG